MFNRLLLILIVLILALAPSAVNAQQDLTLPFMEVDLWPEYDRPSVLVIYHINLPTSVSLPQELTFRIPEAAGQPHAVAVREADGSLFTTPFTQQVSGEWLEVTFQATLPDIQLEYYDPSLVIDGQQRHYEYRWPGDYAVESMTVQVQQPVDTTEVQISPNLGNGTRAQDGLVYYNAQVGSLNAGQTFNITLDYTKTSDALSSTNLDVAPIAPIDESPTNRVTFANAMPWILGVLGVALIVGGAVWYWRSGREPARPQRRTRRRTSAVQQREPAVPPEGEYVYCHQCGKRAGPGDRFCRTCGAQLRSGG